MRVLLDIDGVFARFTDAVNKEALRLFPGCLPSEDFMPNTWYWEPHLTTEQIDAALKACRETENFWLTLKPFQDSVDAMNLVDWKEHDLYFVTDRWPKPGLPTSVQTRKWLYEKIPSLHPNEFSVIVAPESKEYNKKAAVARAIEAQVSLDDKPSNVRALSGVSNHYAFILDRPYNRQGMQDYDNMRVKSVQEFLQRIGLTK